MLSKEKIYAVANELAHAHYDAHTSYNMWMDAKDELVAEKWRRDYKRSVGVLNGVRDIIAIISEPNTDEENDFGCGYEINEIYMEIYKGLLEQGAA